MYKKLVCILLLISITLTACDSGVGNNVGGTPITRNKVVSNTPATKPVIDDVLDYKSGEYRFSYSDNDNFGVLENSLAYKGTYYFNYTNILWIDQKGKIKVLANTNLNKIQLSSYNKFIDFIKDNNDKFKLLYPNLAVIKVIDASSKQVHMYTDKNQLLVYNPSAGTVDMLLDKIGAINNGVDTIIALKIESTQTLLKTIDVSNNVVTDVATLPVNTSLKNSAQDKDSIIASMNSYRNIAEVFLTYQDSNIGEDGESIPVTTDQSYLCNTKNKTCTKEIQVLSVSSTFKVNDSVPRGVRNLFDEYAKSHGSSISSMGSHFKPQGTASEIDWTNIFIITGLAVAFAILGGISGYHYKRSRLEFMQPVDDYFNTFYNDRSAPGIIKDSRYVILSDENGIRKFFDIEQFTEEVLIPENTPHITNDEKADIKQIVKTLQANLVNNDPMNNTDIGVLFKEQADPATLTKNLSKVFKDSDKIEKALHNLFKKQSGQSQLEPTDTINLDAFKFYTENTDSPMKDRILFRQDDINAYKALIEKYNNETDLSEKKSLLACILGRECGTQRAELNTNPIHIKMNGDIYVDCLPKFYLEWFETMKNNDKFEKYVHRSIDEHINTLDMSNLTDCVLNPLIGIDTMQREYIIRLADNRRILVGSGLGLAGVAVTGIYFGFFDTKFKKTVIISDPACATAGNCSIGKVYDSNKQVINDENSKPLMFNSGYIQDAYFMDTYNKTYSISFYRLSNNMTCKQLNTNFIQSNSIRLPTFIEVTSDNKNKMLPIVDGDGNFCNASKKLLTSMITL